jgi:hypothetical protein
MWSQHPEIAKEWTKKYGSKIMPKHKKKKDMMMGQKSALTKLISKGK